MIGRISQERASRPHRSSAGRPEGDENEFDLGIQTATFTLKGNGGAPYMGFATSNNDSLIDDVAGSTIPEPSASLLVGLGAPAFLSRRHR